MHKPKSNPKYYDYLINLINKYGWIPNNKLERKSLNENKLILSLFSLVNLPQNILNSIPFLKNCRAEFIRLSTITKNELKSKNDLEKLYRFNSIYKSGKYNRAYELLYC